MTNELTFLRIAAACFALAAGGSAPAIPNPELAKDDTPVVLKCAISNVIAEEGNEISAYSGTCEVLEVIRPDTNLKPFDLITIAYQVNHAYFENQDRSEMPGPAIETPPPKLVDGETVIAWLRPARAADGTTVYVPNIGMDSFEPVPDEAGRGSSACRDSGDAGPILSNEKACAEQALAQAQAGLDVLYGSLEKRFGDSAAAYRQAGDVALADQAAGQLKALSDSQHGWARYRDETCRLAYLEYYPGSMARLVELDCLTTLTDRRSAQLQSLTSGPGDGSIRY